MDYLFIFTGGFVIWTFIFKRELLIRNKSFMPILGISVVLFLVGVVFHSAGAYRNSFCGALLSPLISLGLFRLCRVIFVRRFNREPKDTYLIWDKGLGVDRVFNIVYLSIAGLCLMLVTIGNLELAKAGW